jgi:DNA-binding SARP family transcriptional activator/tetratricopeptide (TPR) repeat protein
MLFRILGPLSVEAGGSEVPISATRDRIVLAVLLLHSGHPVTVSVLVDAVWGEQPPPTARAQVHTCVSRLRRALAAAGIATEVIVTDPVGYAARVEPAAFDAAIFADLVAQGRLAVTDGRLTDAATRFRTALALWRGPALAGLDGHAVRTGAIRLDEQRTVALEERIEVELALGHEDELVDELVGLVELHPYRERLRAQLMLALYRAGRQVEALAVYRQARRLLADELGLEPGEELQGVHHRILARDTSLLSGRSSRARGGSRAARVRRPNNLPRDIGDFTGRDAQVAHLLAAAVVDAGGGAPVVFAVDGMAGVGKSAFAVHVAHRLARRYPGGQLFLDLHGHSDHPPVAPAGALEALLRQLGVPAERIPASVPERIMMWRTELAERRVLLVLDNAFDTTQVAPLLPGGPGCLVLVTSRRRLVGLDAAHPVPLEMLAPDEAVELLARVVGDRVKAEPDASAEVARRCGYLPLALRLAGARLAHRPGWSVADLAKRLDDARPVLPELAVEDRDVAAAFALSYGHLSPAGQRLFRLLGLHPGVDLDAHLAAALAELELAESGRLLEEMVDAHVVEQRTAGRYRLHDLLREYAAALASGTDPALARTAAVDRLLDCYLHTAARANAHLEPPGWTDTFNITHPPRNPADVGTPDRGMAWLETERPNLVAATHHAQETGRDAMAWQLTRAMWRFLFVRGYTDDLVDMNERGLAATQRLGKEAATSVARNNLAAAYARLGRWDEAIEQLEQALAIKRQLGDRRGELANLFNLGVVHQKMARYQQALEYFWQALALRRDLGDRRTVEYGFLGLIYAAHGRYHAALTLHRHQLAVSRELGDFHEEANALGDIGRLSALLGDYETAVAALGKAMAIHREYADRYGEAEVLGNFGLVYRNQGRHAEAEDCHREALTIMSQIGDRHGECVARNELALTLSAAGQLDEALEQHRLALELATPMRQAYERARALDGMATALAGTDPARARQHWEQALALFTELRVPQRHEVAGRLAGLAP